MLGEQMKELTDVSHEITKLILAPGKTTIKKTFEKEDMILDKLLETEASAGEIVRDLINLENDIAEKLLDCDGKKRQAMSKLCEIEKEFSQACERNNCLETDIKFLKKDLEELKEKAADLQRLELEVDEDTTEVIPLARYLAQLYHKVTKIDWDYDCEPTLIRGIHYGGDVAQPISFDSTKHSKTEVCDYLWSLVPSEW